MTVRTPLLGMLNSPDVETRARALSLVRAALGRAGGHVDVFAADLGVSRRQALRLLAAAGDDVRVEAAELRGYVRGPPWSAERRARYAASLAERRASRESK
jgi:hypothetical protein